MWFIMYYLNSPLHKIYKCRVEVNHTIRPNVHTNSYMPLTAMFNSAHFPIKKKGGGGGGEDNTPYLKKAPKLRI